MKKLIQIVIITFFLIVKSYSANGQNKPAETLVEDKYEKIETADFIAYFPKTSFKVQNQNNLPTSNGKGHVNIWTLSGVNGENPFIYQVSQSVMTNEMIAEIEETPNTINVICNGTMMSFASKLGGEDFKFDSLNEGNLDGMTSTCKVFNGNGIINSKAFRMDNYVFMISAGGKEMDEKKANEFLQMFQLKR